MPSLSRPQILIVDDDEQVRKLLKEYLQEENDCRDVASAEEALSLLRSFQFDLVLSDIQMPGLSGLEMAPRILEHSPDTVVIMISGEQTIDYAIEAMRAGAFDPAGWRVCATRAQTPEAAGREATLRKSSGRDGEGAHG